MPRAGPTISKADSGADYQPKQSSSLCATCYQSRFPIDLVPVTIGGSSGMSSAIAWWSGCWNDVNLSPKLQGRLQWVSGRYLWNITMATITPRWMLIFEIQKRLSDLLATDLQWPQGDWSWPSCTSNQPKTFTYTHPTQTKTSMCSHPPHWTAMCLLNQVWRRDNHPLPLHMVRQLGHLQWLPVVHLWRGLRPQFHLTPY